MSLEHFKGYVFESVDRANVYVCQNCIQSCNAMIEKNEKKKMGTLDLRRLPTPQEIKAFLDQYVVG